ncbi:Jag1p [Chamberlinius hualienensis]
MSININFAVRNLLNLAFCGMDNFNDDNVKFTGKMLTGDRSTCFDGRPNNLGSLVYQGPYRNRTMAFYSPLTALTFMWILILLLQTTLLVRTVDASGYFELQVLGIQNNRGELSNGKCCGSGGEPRPFNGGGVDSDTRTNMRCPNQCSTFFRVCLKEYQSHVTASGSCSFGNTSSAVLGGNSFTFSDPDKANARLVLPFTFRWTRSFTVILEAVDHNNHTPPYWDSVIERAYHSGIILPGLDWHTLTHNGPVAKFTYRIRVQCDPHYYNSTCAKFCRPRDDYFGHYTCDASGEKLCMPGWTGTNCEIAICKPGCHHTHGFCDRPGECVCRPGWRGGSCEECIPYPGCKHGYCNGTPWQCICHTNWGGILCDQDLNYCGTQEPCLNSGTCENTAPDEYKCSCPEGFSGVNCEIVDNPCAISPCLNHGTCSEMSNGFRCNCSPGWTGDKCQTNINECESNPCLHSGTCIDLVNGYRCVCPAGWEGKMCQLDADECAGSPCVNAISCKNEVGYYQCECQEGWTGKNCEHNINDCIGQCMNGGTCIDLISDYHCACLPGYTGRDCQTNINECESAPCQHGGECVDLVAGYFCICTVGFKGLHCEIDDDLCSPNPCQNNAPCFNTQGDYYCQCSDEWEGKNCSVVKMKCKEPNCQAIVDGCSGPSAALSNDSWRVGDETYRSSQSGVCGDHGRCVNLEKGGFQCLCDPGYKGAFCHENINDCAKSPCKNGGTCVDGINTFQCICHDGWEGSLCNINKNECDPNPCRNNGTCEDKVGDFNCECKQGWKGKTCTLRNSHCDSDTCLNGGTCVDLGTSFSCRCPPGWGGNTCQTPKNPACASNPCRNGATCVNSGDSFLCMCKDGYTGMTCETNINDCNPYPCHNGGRCVDGVNWYACQCATGFSGPDCRININECTSSPCAYGSTCIDGIGTFQCLCPPGRTGKRCDQVTPTEGMLYHVGRPCIYASHVYRDNSSWYDDCNLCRCNAGEVTCSKLWCTPLACWHDRNKTEAQVEESCPGDQLCVRYSNKCFVPPCDGTWECRSLAQSQSELPSRPSDHCLPNWPLADSNCAHLFLRVKPGDLPKGTSSDTLCRGLRSALVLQGPFIKENIAVVVLCGGEQGSEDMLHVTVSLDGELEEDRRSALLTELIAFLKRIAAGELGSTIAATQGLVLVHAEVAAKSKAGSSATGITLGVVTSLVIVGCIVAFIVWYYNKNRRRSASSDALNDVRTNKLQQCAVDEKSNNQNEENHRRYRLNPLQPQGVSKEDLCCQPVAGTAASNSVTSDETVAVCENKDIRESDTEDVEVEENIPNNIYYKAQASEVRKNMTPSETTTLKDFQKNFSLQLSVQRTNSNSKDSELIV